MSEYFHWIALILMCVWIVHADGKKEAEEELLERRLQGLRNYIAEGNVIRHVASGNQALCFRLSSFRRRRLTLIAVLLDDTGRRHVDITDPDTELAIEGYVLGKGFPASYYYFHKGYYE